MTAMCRPTALLHIRPMGMDMGMDTSSQAAALRRRKLELRVSFRLAHPSRKAASSVSVPVSGRRRRAALPRLPPPSHCSRAAPACTGCTALLLSSQRPPRPLAAWAVTWPWAGLVLRSQAGRQRGCLSRLRSCSDSGQVPSLSVAAAALQRWLRTSVPLRSGLRASIAATVAAGAAALAATARVRGAAASGSAWTTARANMTATARATTTAPIRWLVRVVCLAACALSRALHLAAALLRLQQVLARALALVPAPMPPRPWPSRPRCGGTASPSCASWPCTARSRCVWAARVLRKLAAQAQALGQAQHQGQGQRQAQGQGLAAPLLLQGRCALSLLLPCLRARGSAACG